MKQVQVVEVKFERRDNHGDLVRVHLRRGHQNVMMHGISDWDPESENLDQLFDDCWAAAPQDESVSRWLE